MSVGSVIDEALEFGKDLAKGKFKLESAEAVNKLGNFTGVFEAAGDLLTGDGVKEALNHTFKTEEGKLKYGKIAGSYIGASAAYRVASGGGLYKDKDGNTNIVGIPFI